MNWGQRKSRVPLLAGPAVAAYTMTMTLVPPHRKRVTHFNEPGQYHELTFFSKSKSKRQQ